MKVTVDRNPKANEAQDRADDIRAKRAKLHQKFEEREAVEKAEPVTLEAPEAPDENLESIEAELPDGSIVEFGPPSGISLSMKIIRILGERAANEVEANILRVLMCVRSIDGVKQSSITTQIDAEKLANKIGDDGLQILAALYRLNWKPVTTKDLKVVKKNLR